MLLEERLIEAAQLEEALEAQVIHGGRLGTNLIELGFLKEKDLARVLGKKFGIAFASGEMVPDPLALALAEANFLDDNDLVPMRVDPTRLTVALIDPTKLEAIDALGFKAGKRVVPVVVPEFRMNQLLRKHFKAFRPLRPVDMNTLRPSLRGKQPGEPSPGEVKDLINEDDFAQLYAKAASADEEEEETIEGVEILDEPSLSGPRPRIIEPIGKVSLVASSEPPLVPLTFAEAQALLSKSVDREDVARTILRFAVSKFRRALLLSVHGEILTGWHGAGQGVREKAVRRIGVSLKEANSFRLVRDSRSHYVGPMKRGPGTAVFYKLLGGGFPTTAVMMPLLVRGKPVHLLYVDQGADELTPPDIGELLILSQSVARSYEAMIARSKAART
ncbi:MAG: ral secretory system protein N-terminal domain protein [Myxococcaceae bacterium]|nr:ral secretory system protein N-terminal domain protein [Myxococcaceae bacterium]